MTANRARGTEGKAGEDADDGDDGEELDKGEGRRRAARMLQFFPAFAGRAYARILDFGLES